MIVVISHECTAVRSLSYNVNIEPIDLKNREPFVCNHCIWCIDVAQSHHPITLELDCFSLIQFCCSVSSKLEVIYQEATNFIAKILSTKKKTQETKSVVGDSSWWLGCYRFIVWEIAWVLRVQCCYIGRNLIIDVPSIFCFVWIVPMFHWIRWFVNPCHFAQANECFIYVFIDKFRCFIRIRRMLIN